jgi:hypothetical protein
MSSFFANFFVPKKLQGQTVIREKLCKYEKQARVKWGKIDACTCTTLLSHFVSMQKKVKWKIVA